MTRKWKTNQTTRNTSVPLPLSKGCFGGRKTRSNRRSNCFRRIFQTVMNLEKMTTEMSSEGPKMVGERYGSAWNGRKMAKSDDPRWRLPLCSSARSERVRLRMAVKFHGDGRLVVALLPGPPVYSGGGRNWLPRLKPNQLENGSKRPSSRFSGFWDFLSGFGVGSSLGTQK